jgi:hypothetical protein
VIDSGSSAPWVSLGWGSAPASASTSRPTPQRPCEVVGGLHKAQNVIRRSIAAH